MASQGMTHPKKIAGFRLPGYGQRTWSDPVYVIPGVSPSISFYDVNEAVVPTHMTDSHANQQEAPGNGSPTSRNLGLDRPDTPIGPQPLMMRAARLDANFNSLPAAQIWQSGWQTRWTGTEWAGMIARISDNDRQLNTNFNPNAPGSKEQQRATTYDPWPSAGALYPKAV